MMTLMTFVGTNEDAVDELEPNNFTGNDLNVLDDSCLDMICKSTGVHGMYKCDSWVTLHWDTGCL